MRYDRQLILPEIGAEGQRKLSAAKVLIVGVGGLGSPVALYLAGAGVGTIGLMDGDVVGTTNLHRQVLYEEGQKGQLKAVCARERLLRLNSEITVNAYTCRLSEDNADILAEYDIIVDCTDNYETRYLISDTCLRHHIPFVYGAIQGLNGQVSVLCKGAACYRTLVPEAPDEQTGKEVVGVTPAIVGSVQASQVLQLICGYGEPLVDRLWTIDLRTLQTYIINI